MGITAPSQPFDREVEATLDWWRRAGVTFAFSDYVTDWLGDEDAPRADIASDGETASQVQRASRSSLPAAPQTSPSKRRDLFDGAEPQTLADFRRWWLEAPGIDAIGPRGRVPPRGSSQALLMVLVLHPEQTDTQSLLSGNEGRLLDNITRAMGLAASDVYLASALPRHTPMADSAAIAAAGMDVVTARHIDLVSPHRLLALGSKILPMLGFDEKTHDTLLQAVDSEWRSRALLVSEGLDSMMAMPRLKEKLWRRWLAWSANG